MWWLILIIFVVWTYKQISDLKDQVNALDQKLKTRSMLADSNLVSKNNTLTQRKEGDASDSISTDAGSLGHKTESSSLDQFSKWLAEDWPMKLGSLLVVVGFGWLITYAFLNNWIGVTGRITLGIMAGSVVLYLGHWWLKKHQHQGLILELLGAAIFLITIYAAQNAYELFDPLIALVLCVLPVFFVAYSSLIYDDRWLALSALVMGSLPPLLVNSPPPNIIGLYGYLLALSVGVIWLAKFQSWNYLIPANILIVGIYSLGYFFSSSSRWLALLTPKDVLALKFFAVTFSSMFFFTNLVAIVNRKKVNKWHLYTALMVGLFSLGWINSLTVSHLQGVFSALVGVGFFIGAFYAYRLSASPYPVYIYAGNALLLLTAGSAYQFDGPQLIMVLSIMAAITPIIAHKWLGTNVSLTLLWYFLLPIVISLSSFDSYEWRSGLMQNSFYGLLSVTISLWVVSWYYYQYKKQLKVENKSLKIDLGIWKSLLKVDSSQIRTVVRTLFVITGTYTLALWWKMMHTLIHTPYMASVVTLGTYTLVGLYCYLTGQSGKNKIMKFYGMAVVLFVVAWLFLVEMNDMSIEGKIVSFISVGLILILPVMWWRSGKQKSNELMVGLFILATIMSLPAQVKAQTRYPTQTNQQADYLNKLSKFRTMINVPDLNLEFPTVVQMKLSGDEGSVGKYAVFELSSLTFQPTLVINKTIPTNYSITSSPAKTPTSWLNDNNKNTYLEYAPESDQTNSVSLTFSYDSSITSNQLNLDLPQYVTYPAQVSIWVFSGNDYRLLVNKQPIQGNRVLFPRTTGTKWRVSFDFKQNLRISEIGFQENQYRKENRVLRFLARPSTKYVIYLNADNYVSLRTGESPNLRDDSNVKLISNNLVRLPNPNYRPQDSDKDGIPDSSDNCPRLSNPLQIDKNHNAIGDDCEDFDKDGILNAKDNCPSTPNRLQQDEDGDGVGDHCDKEESRLVERLSWLPWLGLFIGFGVVALLLRTTVKEEREKQIKREKKDTDTESSKPNKQTEDQQKN